ncbi:hypothetical protein JCGZ_23684 [Jatropha curcas]|uniref:Uncharacterized protein n=1 Tax=Jatropha curcas TaxID=180498 RepID=A0A067LF96_JATCU|nr:hypothetical protein JCGZ_23684 [Jatropha curcas]
MCGPRASASTARLPPPIAIPPFYTPQPRDSSPPAPSPFDTAASSIEARKELHIHPSSVASKAFTRIMKLHSDKEGHTWQTIPAEAKEFYWDEFQAKRMGCEPIPIEVFNYTHTKDHDSETFVDSRVVSINENYHTARERGKKKRKVYRIGSQVAHYYAHSCRASASASTSAQQDFREEEIRMLCTHLDEHERQLANLGKHVMRMSGPQVAFASRDLRVSSDAPTPSIIVPAHDSTTAPTPDTG